MAEHTRKDPRAKVLSMTVRYKSATLDEFIEHHSHDVSRGGMYIKTPQPFPPGTLLKFEVKIAADQKVIQGVGRVVWRRESDEATLEHPAGMGVKFIKLDDESKNIIDQLVTARTGEISAYDEVAPETESPQGGSSESSGSGASAIPGAEGFFPKSADAYQPAPEDRTVMKQATELLQEALKEVGGGSPSDSALKPAPADMKPKAQSGAGVAKARVPVVPEPQELTPRYQKIPTPVAAPARPESPSSKPAFATSAPNATSQPLISDAPKTVPATPMAARHAVPAAPAASLSSKDYELPAKRANAQNRGLRIGITLALVAGVAAGVFAFTRKHAPPPAPETAPTPAVSQKVESAPTVLNVTGNSQDAAVAPSATPSASAVPSEAPAASVAPAAPEEKPVASEKPAAPEAPKVDTTVKTRPVARRKKADAGTASPPPLDTADELYPTPAPAPAKTGSDSTGSAEAPAATTTSKSKSKSAAPAPAPTSTEEAAP
jgi:uncharacterized protein (TIGR02266 family)